MKFAVLVERIKSDRGLGIEVPGFDPANGVDVLRFIKCTSQASGANKAMQTTLEDART
ncbi:hypothetical protein [Halopseudomonas pelagia]|uniref:hypothetical protein n=1 Tax=Halopseudomonas pelagia TaxID=553151 RepID=UPI0030D90BB7